MLHFVNRIAAYAAVFLFGALLMGLSDRAMSQYAGSPGLAVGAQPNATGHAPEGSKLLRKDLWFYLVTDTPNWKGAADIGKRHMAHQVDLEKRGIMFGAGPVEDPNGKHEYGLIIIRAKDAAEEKAIVESDPMQKEGARTYTLHHWTMNEGTVNVKLNYSQGTFELN
jgi:uncharacterized protein YciI